MVAQRVAIPSNRNVVQVRVLSAPPRGVFSSVWPERLTVDQKASVQIRQDTPLGVFR